MSEFSRMLGSKHARGPATIDGVDMSMCERVIAHLDLDCFYAQVERNRLGIDADVPLAVQQWASLIAGRACHTLDVSWLVLDDAC